MNFRTKLIVLLGSSLFLDQNASGHNRAVKALNGWQRTIAEIANELTQGVDGSNFAVDYSSNFSDIALGTILAPSTIPGASSMNIIGTCSIAASDVVTVPGDSVPSGLASGSFRFGASASAPPSFLTKALGAAKLGVGLSKRRSVSYAFDDISIDQVTESALAAKLASGACLSQFNNLPMVYIIRGHYNMQLSMAQGKASEGNIGADADFSHSQSTDPAKVGFSVSWNAASDWKIEQKQARPWFRIVAQAVRQADGSYILKTTTTGTKRADR